MSFDEHTLVALVAVINAVSLGVSLVINALAHAQRPRTVTTEEHFPPTSPSP